MRKSNNFNILLNMSKKLQFETPFINSDVLDFSSKKSKLYKKICKQKEKNTRFGDYKKSTHSTTFSLYLRKEKELNKKLLYKFKKIFCFCFKENLKIDLDDSYFDEYSFYDDINIFEIEDIINYLFFLKKLIKIFLNFLINSKKNELYSEIDLLRYFLTEQVKICPILKTNIVKKYQTDLSRNIKHLKSIDIIPTITSAIIISEGSFIDEDGDEDQDKDDYFNDEI